MFSYEEWADRTRSRINEISVAELAARGDQAPLIIDIREDAEYAEGAIPGAVHIPRGLLESAIAELVDRDTEFVLYCSVGQRSALAAYALQQMGYSSVRSLAEGSDGWRIAGHPWNVPRTFDLDRRIRYARHLALSDVGEEGQRKLLDSKVAIVGAGGLGSPVALYLAAAGVGTIGIVDFDVVEISNLQRQILHSTSRVGEPKVDSAAETLRGLNPDVTVRPYKVTLDADNVLDILGGYDVIVDGADNFPTRYLINDASLHLRVPVVHGSVFRFEGQASVFWPYKGPCYRCLFPEPPPPEMAPSCSEAGVLGVLPGVIGTIQATETIKVLLDIGETLAGKLLTYDALEQEFRTLRLHRDPSCPACADENRPPKIVQYDQYCVSAGTVAR
ncbi:MAG: molybdopterin-synthase adenylyltransferase MoeB [Gammaproteobacteria bacterium]|nr:molybdopterin-synthase adenylyltransferase MoeB [Gammaproteobacteria bacterium]